MANNDDNLVKEGGSDTAHGAVAQMPKKSYDKKKKELAQRVWGHKDKAHAMKALLKRNK